MHKKIFYSLIVISVFMAMSFTAFALDEAPVTEQITQEDLPAPDAESNTYHARAHAALGIEGPPQATSAYLKKAVLFEAASIRNKNKAKESNYKEVMPALSVIPAEIDALTSLKESGIEPVLYTSLGGALLAGGAVVMLLPESTDETKLTTGLFLTLDGALMVFDGIMKMLGGAEGLSAEKMQKTNGLITEYNTYVAAYNAKLADLRKAPYYDYMKKGDDLFSKGAKNAENYKLAEEEYKLAKEQIPTADAENGIRKARGGYAALYYGKYMAQGIEFMKEGKTDVENYNRAVMNFEKAAELKNTDEIKALIKEASQRYKAGKTGLGNKGTDASGQQLY